MKWLLDNMLACFDLETTGINVEQDRIVTACVANLLPDTPTWKTDIQSWLVDPGVEIPQAATDIHGITTEYAREHGEPAAQAVDCIAADVAKLMLARIPMAVCNGSYDYTILDRELRRHNLPTLDERLGRPIGPVLDVTVLDRWLDPYRKGSRKLVDLAAHYGVSLAGAHDSTFDALAAARVAYRIALLTQNPGQARRTFTILGGSTRRVGEIVLRLEELAFITADELHQRQVGWRAEQCDSLRAHFDAKKIAHDGVPGGWPLIAYQQPEVVQEAML